jgi:endonuclease YncB( thermonuclease family)
MYATRSHRLAEGYTEAGNAASGYVAELLGEVPTSVVGRSFKPVDRYGRYLADVFVGASMSLRPMSRRVTAKATSAALHAEV